MRIPVLVPIASFCVALSLALVPCQAGALPTFFSASSGNPAGIQATVDAFRADLGALNPNVAGSFSSGRREINWDGVPDAASAPNNLPANFFNVNSPRGVVFSTPGTGFQVSATVASGTPIVFGNLNVTYSTQFQTFSAQRLFTALGSNVVDVQFFVPGSATAALTRGFGAVFTDVELPNVTSLAFFDVDDNPLGTFFVPAGANGGLSFLGVDFGNAAVRRVRITSGNSALGGLEGGNDLVVMDDFIFAEPTQVPEPGTFALLLAGLTGLGLMARQRRRMRPREISLTGIAVRS